MSVAGALSSRLSLIAGAFLMDPRVTGEARDRHSIGERPIGTTDSFVRLDLDSRLRIVDGHSLSVAVVHLGKRIASAQAFAALGARPLSAPRLTIIDLGAHYLFKLGFTPASFRVALGNLTDERYWRVLASNSFQSRETRRISAYLAADF